MQARSINNYLAAVRAFCRWIHARYPLSWDPGREIPDERVDNKTYQRLPLSPSQVTTLIGSFDDSLIGRRDAAMTYLMAKTGLRAIQIQRADCGDLECLEIQVHQGADGARESVARTSHERNGSCGLRGKGQQTKESFVNLMPEVYERLQRYLEARGPVSPREPLFARHHDKLTAHLVQARAKEGGAEGATLAPNETLRLTTRAIQLRITEAMTRCGLRDAARPGEALPPESRRRRQRRVTPHSLRHTAATEAARTESPSKSKPCWITRTSARPKSIFTRLTGWRKGRNTRSRDISRRNAAACQRQRPLAPDQLISRCPNAGGLISSLSEISK
ncbi:MAG: tyrosine-type recombinase/integrase [Nitrospira sp.]|nr:tyrosine-type recombinase/integrase [Nitrospira sp.]